jgi:hypothetical protein
MRIYLTATAFIQTAEHNFKIYKYSFCYSLAVSTVLDKFQARKEPKTSIKSAYFVARAA